LLGRLGIDAATVVAEIDGRIVERKHSLSRPLRPGQAIGVDTLCRGWVIGWTISS